MPEAVMEDMSAEEQRDQKLIGQELRKLRESRGMTREEMAARLGGKYSTEMVTQYEDGVIPMEAVSVFAMLDALGATLHDVDPKRLLKQRSIPKGYMNLNEERRNLVDQVISAMTGPGQNL